MARGKIQIKLIENSTNRQVTYSKRRNGLFKKANELTVLCDARVSIIMFSTSGKLHEFISPSTTTKQIIDQYQKALGIDVWSTHYEKMQEQLKQLKEVNRNLRIEIRKRMGDCLNDLSIEDLQSLEQEMDSSVNLIRDRKYRILTNQIDTSRKKVRNVEEIHKNLLHELDALKEDPYGLVDNGGDYNTLIGYQNGGPRISALRLLPNHPSLHSGRGSDLTTYPLLD
ncbi:Floral homeotic protein APETALA 3 [Hibiscus syriacus]|uniref:Floral homeotic protein APETALA 3 n=1 Tax=Hibiscus syriacus TaxID=106335 RepID=A0A6A2YS18_HIBSY|nr:floral homeotic protein DEFICIENS-like isoform X1 [Hibiscus syriacus]KAE8682146.1 Floral homeotic protein APETALA 3 [Hibiscus syriacus]